MNSSNCLFLTCIQVSQEAGKVLWYSHVFKNFPQFSVIHTVKGFNIVNGAEVDVFLECPYFLYDPVNVGNLISGSSVFSKCYIEHWRGLAGKWEPFLDDHGRSLGRWCWNLNKTRKNQSWCYWMECVLGGLAVHCSKANKQARLVERKMCFTSDADSCGGRVANICPKADSLPLTSRGWKHL